MKQLLQNLRTGELKVEEVPAPALQPGGVVVRNRYSLVSTGTERAAVAFAQQSLIGKARSRPDLVRQVVNEVRTDGLLTAYRSARERLNTYFPLGYSSAGQVLEVGAEVSDVAIGDLVACAGAGYASHSEVVFVPKNLVVKLPEGVSPRQGAFATLGAIALQGVRRADLTLGEKVAVIGLGLVGQLTVQILRAYGFPVLGLDVDPGRVEGARRWGMEGHGVIGRDDVDAMSHAFSGGLGVDAAIVTASTDTSEPVELAGRILRERGRVSLVGDVGMDVPRRPYYDRELDIRISRSYGPGRYDPVYEERGVDYPIAYARWTERRNMEEFLRLVALGRLNVGEMATHTFPIGQATDAYKLILEDRAHESFLGLLLEYPTSGMPVERRVELRAPVGPRREGSEVVQVGLIGGGMFARGTIMPALRALDWVRVRGVATATGKSAHDLAGRYGCDYATTDYRELLDDKDIDLVIIATRHNLHASIAVESLRAGKHVYVEKPLALDLDQLQSVARAASGSQGLLMVGYNRRYAPLAIQAREHFLNRSTPLLAHYRINAGAVPADHWVHDPVEGGGRILGEVCHFVDLLHFLVGAPPRTVFASRLPANGRHVLADDNVLVALDFADGSRGSILYSALGADSMPKEMLEVMGDGKSATLNSFRTLDLYRGSRKSSRKSGGLVRRGVDKGHNVQFRALVDAIRQEGGPPPVPLEEVLLSSLATLCIVRSIGEAAPVQVDPSCLLQDAATEPTRGTGDP